MDGLKAVPFTAVFITLGGPQAYEPPVPRQAGAGEMTNLFWVDCRFPVDGTASISALVGSHAEKTAHGRLRTRSSRLASRDISQFDGLTLFFRPEKRSCNVGNLAVTFLESRR